MSCLLMYAEYEMTAEDWACILAEKFSDEVTADILGLSVEFVADKRKAVK